MKRQIDGFGYCCIEERDYVPSKEILQKYANVLVNFALNHGKGINKGDVVRIAISECAKPLLETLYISVLKAGGYPIVQYYA